MTNMELAERTIRSLLAVGVREFCLCAGARNSPFVYLIQENPFIKTYHFFEERSASFFALGRIVATRHPVAIITTSGTAVSECLSAVVEGTYSSLPLFVVTADRPKRFRGSGAPQSIEQVGIFSYYIEASFDLDADNTHISFNGLSWRKPVHVNVCFREPLIDGPAAKLSPPKEEVRARFPEAIPMQMVDELQEFLERYRPVVLLSTLPEKMRESAIQFLEHLQAPIYAEAISNLRGHPRLADFEIRSGEKMLPKLIDDGVCDSVLRLGGVPTVRFWRDLEDKRAELPVFSLGYNHYTGLSRHISHYDNLEDLARIDIQRSKPLPDVVRDYDRAKVEATKALIKKYPQAEPSLLNALSKKLEGQSVFLGNSLPIREWDLAAFHDTRPSRVAASRGVNGIDGQVSTFLGWSRNENENWCVIGDLTALYDLSAPWITSQLEAKKIRIVILNNGGGMIFKKMFGEDIFLNRHQVNFAPWASLWNWSYRSWTEVPDALDLNDHEIIEIKVSESQTEAFWREWDQLWL